MSLVSSQARLRSLADRSSEPSCIKTIPRPIRSIRARYSAAHSWADRP